MKLEKYYDQAYDWLIISGSKLLISIIVLLVGLKLIKLLTERIRARMSNRQVHSSLQPFFLSLASTGLYVLLIISVLSIAKIPFINFSAILGGFTVAVGLALSGTFQNFAGGVLILLLKPFELDDNIVAQGQEGKVTSIQIFYTVLLTVDNKIIIIPNGKLFNEVIINVTRQGKRRLDFEIRLGYYVDIDQVKKIMSDTIQATPTVLKDSPVRIGVAGLDLEAMRFLINVWVQPSEFLNTKIALQENILKNLKTAGVRLLGT